MNQANPPRRASCRMRRLALLATTVAGLAVGGLLVAPTFSPYAPLALAQNLSQEAQQLARPTGFADIVEKVKPAVISVRVKMRVDAQPTSSDDETAVPQGLADGAVLPALRHARGRPGRTERAARPPVRPGAGLGLLHLGGRLCRDQQPRGREGDDRRDHDRRRQDPHRQGDRHRSAHRSRADQGRWQQLPLRQACRNRAAHRRLGARGRQSVRPRRHRDRGHRLGARPRHRRRPL